MNGKAVLAVTVVMIQLVGALAILPVFSGEARADKGLLTTFLNGNAVQRYDFAEKGEDWSLSFRLPANATVLNATFKVTGTFLPGSNRVDQRNDTPEGWGGVGNNQPDYNNTTSVDGGTGVQLALNQLGPLGARTGYTAGNSPSGVAIGDINSDGYNEVVACNHDDANIYVYTTDSAGTLTYSTSYNTDSKPWDVVIGDVSGDGLNDVVLSCGDGSTSYVDVLTQKSDGTLSSMASYTASSGSSQSYFVAVGDVNQDSLNDVVTINEAGKQLQVFTQTSSGTLNSATSYSVGDYPSGVSIGDFCTDKDGNEVASFDKGSTYYGYYTSPTLRLWEQDINYALTKHATYNYGSWIYDWQNYQKPRPLEVGDVSGDGKDDVVFCWYDGSSTYLSVYCQTGGDVSSRVDYTNGVSSPRHLAIGDINNDGLNEVVLCNIDDGKFQIYNQTANGRLNSMKGVNTGKEPTGIAIGDINRDNKNDVATADSSGGEVGVYLQLPWFNGSFTSRAITAPKPNDYAKVLDARPYWNISANGQSYSVWLSNDDVHWTNVTGAKGQWLTFSTVGSSLKYRIYMNSTKASGTPRLNNFQLDYNYGTDPKDIVIDIANDGDFIEYDHKGFLNGSDWLNDFSSTLNQYLLDHQGDKDSFGYIQIPIYFRCGGMGTLAFSNISIIYDRPPYQPILLSPTDNSYVSSTPTLRILCRDPDNDTLKYYVELSTTRDFASVFRTLDMTTSTLGWTKANFSSEEVAVYNTLPAMMLESGMSFYWRARAFDGTLWSDWSRTLTSVGPGFFSIDSVAPEATASSPQYTKSNDFEVTWSGNDPMPGSHLTATPFDVQYKVDDGDWTDWMTQTADTKATYSGEPGHTYYFRVRATDIAGNRKIYSGGDGDTSTIIDPNPPTSSVKKLPDFVTGTKFTVEWTGTDGVGGSGILNYDIQVRDGAGAWTDCLPGTASTSAEYDGLQGHTYRFQSRAHDRAGNLEDYPGGDGDSRTTVDTTPPAGFVTDDGSDTASAISLHATLQFSESESGIAGFEYRVGTSRDGSDIVRPTATSDSDLTIPGLNLSVGPTYYIGARARNGAGLWSGWSSSDGIVVSSGANVATINYTDGMQNDVVIHIQLGGSTAGGVRISDGELQVRKATYYRGELGSWSNWMDVGAGGHALVSSDYTGERGQAYQFRYRIRSELNVWSGYAAPSNYVRINAPPVAVGGTDMTSVAGRKLAMDGSNSWDPDGDAVAAYLWNFGDRSKPDTRAATSHSFKKAGTYLVTLTVSDGHLNATTSFYVRVRNAESSSTPGFEGAFAILAVAAALVLALVRRRR
jgi:hypothetical protein